MCNLFICQFFLLVFVDLRLLGMKKTKTKQTPQNKTFFTTNVCSPKLKKTFL